MNLLGEYLNGNYKVRIYDDGTKIRETDDDNFISIFPECMDIKITNRCDMCCPYCHENSNINGLHGDILQVKFIDTIRPYTELAIGGGNPLDHPDIIPFLQKLKDKNIIANITVNQSHFMRETNLIAKLIKEKLVHGIGVSLIWADDDFINKIRWYPNAVIHVINGVVNINDLYSLSDNNLKILILGYKQFRRGEGYYSEEVEKNKKILYDELPGFIERFAAVSFDNLAVEQLNVRRLMSQKRWDEFYMGDDGQFTMYVDLVEQKFARCSVSTQRYGLMDNINDMFRIIKAE